MPRRVLLALIALVGFGPILLLVLALDLSPAIGTQPTASSLDAARTKALVLKLKYLLDPDFSRDRLSTTQTEMNSAFAIAEHALPHLRGRATLSEGGISLDFAIQAPGSPIDLWANVSISVVPLGGSLEIQAVKLGRLQIPGVVALSMLRAAGNVILGEDVVGMAVASVRDADIRGTRLTFAIDLSAAERAILLTKGKKLFYTLSPSDSVDIVRFYYRALDQAAYDGRLPYLGSFAAYLRFALKMANEQAGPGDAPDQARSAILALAI